MKLYRVKLGDTVKHFSAKQRAELYGQALESIHGTEEGGADLEILRVPRNRDGLIKWLDTGMPGEPLDHGDDEEE